MLYSHSNPDNPIPTINKIKNNQNNIFLPPIFLMKCAIHSNVKHMPYIVYIAYF
nr:MAG TPA: hypothetical protein [Caudoviricetes sp.]